MLLMISLHANKVNGHVKGIGVAVASAILRILQASLIISAFLAVGPEIIRSSVQFCIGFRLLPRLHEILAFLVADLCHLLFGNGTECQCKPCMVAAEP